MKLNRDNITYQFNAIESVEAISEYVVFSLSISDKWRGLYIEALIKQYPASKGIILAQCQMLKSVSNTVVVQPHEVWSKIKFDNNI